MPRQPHPEPAAARSGHRLAAPAEAAGQRLDAWLAGLPELSGLSRSRIQDAVRAGLCLVDGRAATKPGQRLAGGEEIILELPEASGPGPRPEAGTLRVVHADQRLLVLDKPPGLTVHPAPGRPDGTLVNILAHHYPALAAMEGARPGIVHRIDKDTSGLIAVALDEPARLALSEQFADRDVDKAYLALVLGRPEPARGHVDAPIGRHPRHKTRMAVVQKGGRKAVSDYETLWTAPNGSASPNQVASLVRVVIHTGRTHQIRVHMAHLGHPVLGDATYGGRPKAFFRDAVLPPALARRQMLHAWRLALDHPDTGERMSFCAPVPKDMARLPLLLARQCMRLVVIGMPGSGKSALTALLAEEGVPVFSADAAVSELYLPGADAWLWLHRRYGDEVAPENGPVNRRALGALMRDAAARREVQDMVHPMVAHRLGAFWDEHGHCRLAAAEVPLMAEAGWAEAGRRGRAHGLADVMVCVVCPQDVRRKRLAESRGWDDETIADIESWQWSEADKLTASDLAVDNSGDLEALRREARSLLLELRARRRRRMRVLSDQLDALWGCPDAKTP